MIDSKSITDLHPCVKRGAEELIKRCKSVGVELRITSTYRDSEYQNKLYAQGRTTPGSVVTNAKGGQSIHNYALAFDFAPVEANGAINWSSSNSKWKQVGKIWEELGGEWGGSWTGFVDLPHCQYTGGLTLAQLQNGRKLDSDTKMKWEVRKIMKIDIVIKDEKTGIEEKISMDAINEAGNNYIKLQDFNKGILLGANWNGKNTDVMIKKV